MNKLFLLLLFAFSINAKGQTFTKVAVKAGLTLSGQVERPHYFEDGGMKPGFSATIEPTILTFGAKKQFDLNTDLSFIQKGGMVYSPVYVDFNGTIGIGSEIYGVTINYFSASPTIKTFFSKKLFIKAGPRIDIFSGFKSKTMFTKPATRKDFNSLTYGVTYGLGICFGKKSVKFISELIGQNDFTTSSYNKITGQHYENFSFLLNLGFVINLKKSDE